jgi:hypothetical protein
MHTLASQIVHQPSTDFHPGPKQFGTILSAFERSRQRMWREQCRPGTGFGHHPFIQLKTQGFKYALAASPEIYDEINGQTKTTHTLVFQPTFF